MLIADAQVHIWAANTPERPWPVGPVPHRPEPFSKDDLLREMDAAGVTRAILVPPAWDAGRNDLVLNASHAHPDRFAVMGRMAWDRPENAALVAELKKQPFMMGLRMTVSQPSQRPLLAEGKADWLWPAAERANVPTMVRVIPDLLPYVKNIAEKHPGLKLAIVHLALPQRTKDDAAFANLSQVLAVAKYPNVSVTITALPGYSSEAYPYRGLHKYVRQVYDAYGPERMIWGSDLTRLPCTYRQAVTVFTEEMPWLTTTDQEWIMGRTLCKWLDWSVPAKA